MRAERVGGVGREGRAGLLLLGFPRIGDTVCVDEV
jgi:hypothetical protein